jgi:rhodanese-related sulfurtransferase
MRRILALALVCAVGVWGCSDSGDEPTPPASRGTHGVNYWVSVSGGLGGVVTSSDGGIDCGEACGAFFPWAAEAVLTATPAEGHVFRSWAGDCMEEVTSGAVCTLPSGQALNSATDRVVVAIFDPAPPPLGTAPLLAVATAGETTESPVAVTASALDPDEGDTISCSLSLLSQPRLSALSVAAVAGDCRAAELSLSFTPFMDGVYVVRVTASDGVQPLPVTRDLALEVDSRYGGGEVAGTAAAPTAALTQLLADLATIPANGGQVTALNVFRDFANIARTGSPPAQGPALGWAERPWDVIDIRDAADFAAGHIPGAINVPLEDLPRVLLANPYFPDDADRRRVLVAGYSQGDSSLGAILVTAGRFSAGPISTSPDHRAYFLSSGMATWTFDKGPAPLRWDDDLGTRRFAWTLEDARYVESSGTAFTKAGKPTYEYPNLGAFNAATSTPMKRVLVRAREWASWAIGDADTRGIPRNEAFVTHWGRYKEARDADEVPQVLTVQNDSQWMAAHATNSYRAGNSGTGEFVNPLLSADLPLVDPTRPVLYHCFTNTGAVSPCFQLSMLGYPARTVLYGISGAVASTLTAAGYSAGFVSGIEDKGSGGNDFPVASDANPIPEDSLAWARPAADGCRSCHEGYAAHYAEVILRPFTAPAPEVPSEGEG